MSKIARDFSMYFGKVILAYFEVNRVAQVIRRRAAGLR